MKRCKLLVLLSLCVFLISCSADVNLSLCDMNVKQGNTDIPCTTGYFNFGNIPLYYSQTITFTIENTGVSDLELTSVEKVQIIGQDADEFELILDQTDSQILPNSDTDFSVKFNPKSMGTKTATISIPNNDKDENPYTFVVVGNCTPPAPEMHIVQNTTDILCATGSFDFGYVTVNTSSEITTFTIQNNGDEDLNLTGSPDLISKSGADSDLFVIDQTYTYSPISSGKSTKFYITFKPTSPGIKTAKISIINNDSDENPYTFTITGTGVTAPEINVKLGLDDIPSGTGEYKFADTLINESSLEVIFTIENLGTATLHLSDKSDYVKITGTDPTMFSTNVVSTNENIAPGSSTTFGLFFNPTQLGDLSATVSIANNDDDENPYTFSISGKVLQPEINIKQGSENIANSTGTFDIGGAIVNTSGEETEFTIENLGDGDLKLSGSPIVEFTGANASEFTANISSTSTTISPSNHTTFKIRCNPTSKGNKTALVSIVNNDLDENPYTFTIIAHGNIYTKGDFNGDGFPDFIVGAEGYDDVGKGGCIYIYFGRQNWSPSYNAANADVKITPDEEKFSYLEGISLIGDINYDGYEDFALSSQLVSTKKGRVYIFFGRHNWNSSYNASDSDFKINGDSLDDHLASSASAIGDINDDGIDDFIIGAERDHDGGSDSGRAFIFFGRQNWNSAYVASDANVKINGESSYDYLGSYASYAGDINNDGIDDLMIGAIGVEVDGYSSSGGVYIFFGRSNWSSISDASDADVKLTGERKSKFGLNFSNVGDINNDGIDDIAVSAPWAEPYGHDQEGTVYVFFGRQLWNLSYKAINADVLINGTARFDRLNSIAPKVDINNDGVDDLIIGSNGGTVNGNRTGAVYIFVGRMSWNPTYDAPDCDILLYGENSYDDLGSSVTASIDLNNDGINDLIIGADGDDDGGDYSGCAFIFYGKSNWNAKYDSSKADVKFVGGSEDDEFGYLVDGQ